MAVDKQRLQQLKKEYDDIASLSKEIRKELEGQTKGYKDRIKLLKAQKSELKEQHSLLMDEGGEYLTMLDSIKKIVSSSRDWTKGLSGNKNVLGSLQKIAEKIYNSSGKQKELYEDIYNTQTSILSLTKKSQMLSFDYEATLEEIADMEATLVELKKDQSKEAQKQTGELEDLITKTKDWAKHTKEVSDEIKKTSAATEQLKDASGGLLDTLESSALVMKGMISAIMANPLLAFAAAAMATFKAFQMINSERVEFQQGMGISRETSKDMAKELMWTSARMKLIGIDAKEVGSQLQDAFGTLSSVTPEVVTELGLMEKGLGVSTEHSTLLMQRLQTIGGLTAEGSIEAIKFGSALAMANDVAPGRVMADIAENTDAFADYAKDGGKNIMKAAVAARKLGLNLSTTAKIADSLLDFETSIEAEMEASMLIGKQLNFNKARQLALEGDIAGAAADVMKQVGGQAEFEKMNVIQRRKLAEAIGVSTDELSKMTKGGEMKIKQPDKSVEKALKDSMDEGKLAMDNLLNSTDALTIATWALVATMGVKMLAGLFKGGGGGKMLNKMNPMNWGKKVGKTGMYKQSSKGFISKGLGSVGKGMKGIGTKALTMGGGLLATGGKLFSKGKGFFGKMGGKIAGKGLGKTAIKKIPFVGAIAGLGFAASRLMKGDGLGALGEVASGVASIIPGLGTAASLAIDTALIAKDVSQASKEANDVAKEVSEEAIVAVKQKEVVDKPQTGKEMRAELEKEYSDLNKGQQTQIEKALASGIFEPFVQRMLEGLPAMIAAQMDPIVKNNLVQTQEYLEVLQKVAENTGKTTSEIANLTT